MNKSSLTLAIAATTLGLSFTQQAAADFFEDSKASLELRNFYFNRDFRDEVSATANQQSKQDEWAQGFLLRYESGYTEGPIGFGVDALGLLGVTLDSSPDRTGTGLLPGSYGKRAPDEYSELGLTAKFRVSKSELKVGTLMPKNPLIGSNDSRLLPQAFQGGQLKVGEIKNLTLDAGYLNRVNQRNSSDYEDISMTTGNQRQIRISGGSAANEADDFIFAGGTYRLWDQLNATYYYGELDQLYKQHSVNLVHVWPIGEKQSFKTDLRYARSKDDGLSNVDNDAYGALFTYSISGHSLGLGYQQMSGDTGFAYISGTDPFLVNYIQIGDFANKDEKSWQVRYDYDFAAMGIPGLVFMTRYVSGDNVDIAGSRTEGKEWERNTDITYRFQDGYLKNMAVRWRNATMRSNFVRDIDENRLIVSYTLPLR